MLFRLLHLLRLLRLSVIGYYGCTASFSRGGDTMKTIHGCRE